MTPSISFKVWCHFLTEVGVIDLFKKKWGVVSKLTLLLSLVYFWCPLGPSAATAKHPFLGHPVIIKSQNCLSSGHEWWWRLHNVSWKTEHKNHLQARNKNVDYEVSQQPFCLWNKQCCLSGYVNGLESTITYFVMLKVQQ